MIRVLLPEDRILRNLALSTTGALLRYAVELVPGAAAWPAAMAAP